jgi:cytochrome c-type biogenesis protein CcmH
MSPRRALAVVAAAMLALNAGLPASGAAQSARTTLPIIERQVMCVTCKIPLNVAQSPAADDERALIQELIDRGQSEAQIKRALVAQYGRNVLALPATHGFDLAAYLVPVFVVLALLAVLAVMLVRWRARARTRSPDAPGEQPSLSPAQSALLDADMARHDR